MRYIIAQTDKKELIGGFGIIGIFYSTTELRRHVSFNLSEFIIT
ncbi:MAG: hypothetical protein ACKVH8_08040 [Pirellulales bacterium]